MQLAAATDRRVPITRRGRVPITDRIGMATAPQDVQRRLKHDGPLATTAWQRTDEIRETLQRNGELDVNLPHGESPASRRALSSRSVSADPSCCVTRRPHEPRPRPRRDREQRSAFRHDKCGRLGTKAVARFVVFQKTVPLACPQLQRGVGVEQ